jgi:hypothetical protein
MSHRYTDPAVTSSVYGQSAASENTTAVPVRLAVRASSGMK